MQNVVKARSVKEKRCKTSSKCELLPTYVVYHVVWIGKHIGSQGNQCLAAAVAAGKVSVQDCSAPEDHVYNVVSS